MTARIGSLNGIEDALGNKGALGTRWQKWMGGELPSADRLGQVAALLNLDAPVRVVRSEETRTVRRQLTKDDEEQRSEWLWATSLSKAKAVTHTVVRIGHGRWSIENQGFNELVHEWHADHVYHLNTNAIVAILLLLFLAYDIFHVWLERGLKPALRQRHTAKYFSRQLQAEFYAALLRPG